MSLKGYRFLNFMEIGSARLRQVVNRSTVINEPYHIFIPFHKIHSQCYSTLTELYEPKWNKLNVDNSLSKCTISLHLSTYISIIMLITILWKYIIVFYLKIWKMIYFILPYSGSSFQRYRLHFFMNLLYMCK